MNYLTKLFPLQTGELLYKDSFGIQCLAYVLKNREDKFLESYIE